MHGDSFCRARVCIIYRSMIGGNVEPSMCFIYEIRSTSRGHVLDLSVVEYMQYSMSTMTFAC